MKLEMIPTNYTNSYIKTREGNIFIVRSETDNHSMLLAKLIYLNNRGHYFKIKENNGHQNIGTQNNFSFNLKKDLQLINKKEIIKIWTARKVRKIDTVMMNISTRQIVKTISENSTVLLFGSRLLGIEKSDSDWDFLVETKLHPKMMLEKLLSCNSIRSYSEKELTDRAKRYASQNPFYDETFLIKLFSKTNTYLKNISLEIGIFFQNLKPYNKLPLKYEYIKCIKGILVKGNGESYYMPRRFKINIGRRIITILTTEWVLAGIEEFQGSSIIAFQLIQVQEDAFWLDPYKGHIKLLF